jgi:endonuclease/exonuclease/phosphatase family metal-dependent hydrolase
MAQGEPPTIKLKVACWNIMGETTENKSADRQTILRYYIDRVKKREEQFVPDLIFLQEVPWVLPKVSAKGEKNITAALLEGTNYWFTDTSWEEERGSCYTVILYNSLLMDCNFGDGKGNDLEYSLTHYIKQAYSNVPEDGRVAISAFCVRCNPPQPKLIAVSFHNTISESVEKVQILIEILKKLHKLTGYPILLAGDFNTDVTEIDCRPFSKPDPYNLTGRRLRRIDNIMLWDESSVFKLDPIIAHMPVLPATLGINPDQSEASTDKTFDHDPLTSTLQVQIRKEPVPELLSPPPPRVCADKFTVFSWNVQCTLPDPACKPEYKVKAIWHELGADLAFLQDAKYIPGNLHMFGYHLPIANQDNVILYKHEKFEYSEADTKKWHKEAKKRLKLKRRIISAFANSGNFKETIRKLITENSDMKKNITSWANNVIQDASFRYELQFLLKCCPDSLPKELDKQFALAVLHRKPRLGSIIAVSLRITVDHSKRMLISILYLLKELRQCLPQPYAIPILLAGDFNMDVFSSDREGSWMSIYPLLPYNPQPYKQANRTEKEANRRIEQTSVDYIMLWDDSDVTWTLRKVCAKVIDVEKWRTDCGLKKRWTTTLENWVSTHDPITAELRHHQKQPTK